MAVDEIWNSLTLDKKKDIGRFEGARRFGKIVGAPSFSALEAAWAEDKSHGFEASWVKSMHTRVYNARKAVLTQRELRRVAWLRNEGRKWSVE